MFSENRNKFLTVGNITKDVIKTKLEEQTSYGGNSYCGIAAKELGWESTILSRGNEELSEWVIELEDLGVRVFLQQDESVTFFCHDYTSGERVETLLGNTEKIIFDVDEKFDIIHINPLFKEADVDLVKKARKKCKLLSMDVQGLVRDVENKKVVRKFLDDSKNWFKSVDILHVGQQELKFVSEEKSPEDICKDLKSLGAKIVVLTFGKEGSIISGKNFYKIPALAVKEVDPTGAGDVYSTAFAIKYFETKDEREAGFFGAATASFVVEDFGARNIQPREKIEERLKQLNRG
ncbi:MAG: PfkB family carbohydrate kinase [Candidatus Aenigmatarchaeota archaeon]